MSEFELGAICKRAMVESYPQIAKVNDEPFMVTVYVRYRRKNTIFPVSVKSESRYFKLLTELRPGDEMFVSHDGEDITDVVNNPPLKRLWRRLTWSF